MDHISVNVMIAVTPPVSINTPLSSITAHSKPWAKASIVNSSISFLSVPDQFLPLSIFYLNFLATLQPQTISTTVAAKQINNKYYIGAKNAVTIDPAPMRKFPIILPCVILCRELPIFYSVCVKW